MQPPTPVVANVFRAFFLGNWAYGLCAVALGVEAAWQQAVSLPPWPYQVLLFAATVLFYTHAYRSGTGTDERARWYASRLRWIGIRQFVLALVCVAMLVLLLTSGAMRSEALPMLCLFPAIGLAYYGTGAMGLRHIGWLKPIVLGVVWAGVVTWHPAVLAGVGGIPFLTGPGVLLFLKNMLYVALLGVLFDIKDHAEDHRRDLRTLVVVRGLRATLFRVVVPTLVVGGLLFLAYAHMRGFSWQRTWLNMVPFAAFVLVVHALRRKRSLLYYLTVVDGLLLLKAVCGMVAVRWF